MDEILTLENVSLSYHTARGETEALAGVSFGVRKGEFLAIVGPSGCGKTTVLSVVAGLLRPTSGSVVLDGRPVTGPGGTVGYMLQKDTLFEWLTISRNVELGLKVQKKLTAENRAYARSLLQKYGLEEFADHLPGQLSGGMRQRAALIRTLAFRPKVLLLDEPFSALDYQTRLSVAENVSGIIRSEGVTALLVTHDIAEACSLGDRVVVLSPRPAVVRKIFDIPIAGGPEERRADKRFNDQTNAVWKELKATAEGV